LAADPDNQQSFCPACVRHSVIVLSVAAGVAGLVRRGFRRGLRRARLPRSPLRPAAVVAALLGGALTMRMRAAARERTACEDERDEGLRGCAAYEDRGYSACARYEDQGYSACSRYEDQGYNSCREWRKNCCDWWPCSWVCEVFSWICVAWVWVTNVVCVAWVWVTHLVCVLWTWVTNLVCVAWWWIRFPICWILCILRRIVTGNERSWRMSECIYGWTAAYRITEEKDCRLHVVVRIRLQPDPGVTQAQLQAAQNVWEPAIEQAWTRRFDIRRSNGRCACRSYSVDLDVQWVTSGEHHVVRVHAGSGRADMGNFFLNNTGGTAAHEVGHMLGNPDEYTDAACPNRNVTNDNSIMQTSQTGTVRPRHYQGFADWITSRTCCTYVVASD
jgi:hypothetical protein